MTLRVSDYVKTNKPRLMGNRKVISIGDSEKVTIFFLQSGKRIFYNASSDLEHADSHHSILELAGSVSWKVCGPEFICR
jgi:hypothetical protein